MQSTTLEGHGCRQKTETSSSKKGGPWGLGSGQPAVQGVGHDVDANPGWGLSPSVSGPVLLVDEHKPK